MKYDLKKFTPIKKQIVPNKLTKTLKIPAINSLNPQADSLWPRITRISTNFISLK